MRNIVSIHALARHLLRRMFDCRYMPRGFSREGNRKSYDAAATHEKTLNALLAGMPDKLVPWPTYQREQVLLREAAACRTLSGCVKELVRLLYAEPETDQEAAYSLAALNDRQLVLQRIKNELEHCKERIETLAAGHKDAAEALNLSVLTKELGMKVQAAMRQIEDLEYQRTRIEDELYNSAGS